MSQQTPNQAKFSPFDETYWYASAQPAPSTVHLQGEVKTDVCIVGAGYTGLTTAIELARSGTSVVLLEREEVGFGGSGRNAGHFSPTFAFYMPDKMHSLLGKPWGERMIRRQTRAADVAAKYITRYDINCEWVQEGLVIGAMRPGHLPALEIKTRQYNAAGARTRMLNGDEAIEITASPRLHGAWLHEEAAHLHPLSYSRGLAHGALAEGAQLFTGSPAENCEAQSGKWKIRSRQGHVIADKVIFATGAYTIGGWPKLDQSFRIMPVFVAATTPMSNEARKTILPRNTSFVDGRGDFICYKWTADNRIVASMFPMGKRGQDISFTKTVMTERLKWMHPDCNEDFSWEYYWNGELDMQFRTVPRLYDLAPGIVGLTGLSGRGVPTGTMLGGVLAEWARGMPEHKLDIKVEKLHRAPWWMKYAPQYKLHEMRIVDNIISKWNGIKLPPHH